MASETAAKKYTGGCHCKRFRYKYTHSAFENGECDVGNCNCSVCNMNALLFIYVPETSFELTSGSVEELTRCTFNTKSYYHHFCPTCGTEIIGKTGGKVGINVRMVDGIRLEKLKLKPFDGAALL
ncbi:uncharacterized protein PHACADRAFT_197902 [Phanerochaete carnosa HHB-10118-sp]|uniref:CENP-V/GFA domain-containing protein n=1 Tax=Phanerochaete carnosa (strain HHB-10118-sp) TaxID=650164 RepID=K5WST0_PHACS|nr:uncharacterized protein PHACADRAFT_197902 [Phanerochaete carnosa HHB-10118-sp]EKM53472.1 hypothetical protein PHACADRAFT_197902 [Phanerochaete carnosa HHB-10118-sp]